MAVLPEEIPTGTLTGQFFFVNEDNIDADTNPELTVVKGFVRCVASVKTLRMATKKAVVIPLRFDAKFDGQGNLVPALGNGIGMKMPAVDSNLFDTTGWTWTATFELTEVETGFTVNLAPVTFQIFEGQVTDLSDVIPVEKSPGVITTRGVQGDVGPAGLDGSNVLPTNDAVAQAINTEGPTKTALSAAIDGSTSKLDQAFTNHLPPLAKIQKARTGPFRILLTGTSISSFGQSTPRVIVEHLATLFGDTQAWGLNLGFLGGGWDNTVSGWKKQVYGGPQFHRLVSTATSTPIPFAVVGNELALWTSREADSAPFEVISDGVSLGMFGPSAGAQAYGQAVTIPLGVGSHMVTINPPATGKAYLERAEGRKTTRTGVEWINATLGGSGIWNATTNRATTANQLASIPIVGDNGLAAHFNRDDIDLWIVEHIFNDTGAEGNNGVFEYNMNYAVEQARKRAKPIVFIIEPGGGQSDTVGYKARRDFLLSLRVHPHVTVIDWHAAIWPGTQAELLSLYYSGADTSHPLQQAYDVLNGLVTRIFNVPPVTHRLNTDYEDARNRDMSDFYKGVAKAATVNGVAKTYAVPEAPALRIVHGAPSGWSNLPGVKEWAYRDEAAPNKAGPIQTEIDASATSDQYGKYMDYSNKTHYVNYVATPDMERFTATVKASGTFQWIGGTPLYIVDENGVKVPYNEPSLNRHNLRHEVKGAPVVFTFTFTGSTTAAANTFFSGRIYELSIVKSNVPIIV